MTTPAPIGHNAPPDPIDEALAPFADFIEEAENWLDGSPVKNAAQMSEVDKLTAQIKAAIKAATEGQKSESAPLHDAWKAALARWKPTIDDLTRIKGGLLSIVGDFKKRAAADAAEKRRAAWREAERLRLEAEAKAADAGNIEDQRAAEDMRITAAAAEQNARSVEKVKGLRTVHRYEITDHRAALRDIAKNDRDAVTAFVDEYVRKNHRARAIDGVRCWDEKETF